MWPSDKKFGDPAIDKDMIMFLFSDGFQLFVMFDAPIRKKCC